MVDIFGKCNQLFRFYSIPIWFSIGFSSEKFHGTSMIFRWFFDGSSMVLRWFFDGSSMVLRWFFDFSSYFVRYSCDL